MRLSNLSYELKVILGIGLYAFVLLIYSLLGGTYRDPYGRASTPSNEYRQSYHYSDNVYEQKAREQMKAEREQKIKELQEHQKETHRLFEQMNIESEKARLSSDGISKENYQRNADMYRAMYNGSSRIENEMQMELFNYPR